jgi:hypothetical protein
MILYNLLFLSFTGKYEGAPVTTPFRYMGEQNYTWIKDPSASLTPV